MQHGKTKQNLSFFLLLLLKSQSCNIKNELKTIVDNISKMLFSQQLDYWGKKFFQTKPFPVPMCPTLRERRPTHTETLILITVVSAIEESILLLSRMSIPPLLEFDFRLLFWFLHSSNILHFKKRGKWKIIADIHIPMGVVSRKRK